MCFIILMELGFKNLYITASYLMVMCTVPSVLGTQICKQKLCFDFFLLICQIEVVRSFSSDPNLIALVELFGDKDPSNERVSEALCSFNRTINNATF